MEFNKLQDLGLFEGEALLVNSLLRSCIDTVLGGLNTVLLANMISDSLLLFLIMKRHGL